MDYGSQTTSGVGSELLTASLSLEIIGNVYAAGMPRNGSSRLLKFRFSQPHPAFDTGNGLGFNVIVGFREFPMSVAAHAWAEMSFGRRIRL
jgi:hypothetical protein